jgi:hypothetical protein
MHGAGEVWHVPWLVRRKLGIKHVHSAYLYNKRHLEDETGRPGLASLKGQARARAEALPGPGLSSAKASIYIAMN